MAHANSSIQDLEEEVKRQRSVDEKCQGLRDDCNRLKNKFNTLRTFHEKVTNKYRKDKQVWKAWVAFYNSKAKPKFDHEKLSENYPRPTNKISTDEGPEGSDCQAPALYMPEQSSRDLQHVSDKGRCGPPKAFDTRTVHSGTAPALEVMSEAIVFCRKSGSHSTPLFGQSSQDIGSLDLEILSTGTKLGVDSPNAYKKRLSRQEDVNVDNPFEAKIGSDHSMQSEDAIVCDSTPKPQMLVAPSRTKTSQFEQQSVHSHVERLIISPNLITRNKGRGRYHKVAKGKEATDRLADTYVTKNPVRDAEPEFAFHEVVRGSARKNLPATDCQCCTEA